MAIRKRMKALQRWGDRISHNIFQPLRALVNQLLRSLFLISIARRQRDGKFAGFVLPTTILLLLVLSLAVGSISLRTLSRTQQVAGDRQQRVIYNAATPAIDRAKAKIAYLIERHEKNTPGIPPEDELVKMMLNQETGFADESVDDSGTRFSDIYTFDNANNPGIVDTEERIDVDGDGKNDNAWLFKSDTDGDDEPDAWIAYSILFETPNPIPDDPNDPNDTGRDTIDALRNVKPDAVAERAKNLEVRNGPRSLLGSGERCPAVQQGSVEEGWFSDESNTVFLRKNFQINAIVIPGVLDEAGNLTPNQNATVSTLEMQQDRTFDVGNKWGAWFQSDLEVFPGRDFNWNGAMRTQGSLVVGKGKFNGYLISSKYSCFNIDKSASEVRVGENIITGQVDGGDPADATFHIFTEFGTDPLGGGQDISLGNANRSEVAGTADYQTVNDIGDVLLLDPVKTFLQGLAPTGTPAVDDDENPLRDDPDDFGSITLDDTWNDASALADRITVASTRADQPVSYGDTYRHDRRPGPTPITGNSLEEIKDDQGDWEDLAHQEGLRVIVGQRLGLGLPNSLPGTAANAFWDTNSCAEADNRVGGGPDRCHEARQRVTLKDKLAAVQATVMYRADVKARPFRDDGEVPLACLATTVHPGTAETLARAATYHDVNAGDFSGVLLDSAGDPYLAIEDFFSGRGTNGWEFEPPLPANQDQPLLDAALENLANFAGDPKGGAPYFEAEQDDFVHPYPAMAMWGDFSILRRVLEREEADALADKTTQDTAKCLLGMLAHNISYLNSPNLDLSLVAASGNPINTNLTELNDRINQIITAAPAGVTSRAAGEQPEAFLRSLEQWSDIDSSQVTGVTPQMLNIARFLTTREQVRRDRDYGFEAANGINNDPNGRIGCSNRLNPGSTWPGLVNLCSDEPRYPILYSVFPGDTDHDGDAATTSTEKASGQDTHFENQASRGFDPTLPLPDQTAVATDDNYLLDLNNTSGSNPQGQIKEGVNDFVQYTAFSDEDIEKIALNPLPMGSWALPHKGGTSASNKPNSATDVLIKCDATVNCDGEFVRVAFKDAALMDGRQLMNVRVLDLNMDLLSDPAVTVSPNGGQRDTWLPSGNSALVYLFREDAVREDSIVRPVDPTRNIDCVNDIEVRKPECWLQAGNRSVFDSTDSRLLDIDVNPDVNGDEYKASVKPVDYWTDPDRRPYGFRLRNGEDLSRLREANINESISVISHQPVYLFRDFNLHKAYGGGELQEFQGGANLLDFDDFTFNNFYERGEALGSADERFAASSGDQWRQTEVFSDAVTILSNNFCDGSIEDLFTYSQNRGQLNGLQDSYGCVDDNGYTSYTNFTRLEEANQNAVVDVWVRENSGPDGEPFDLGAPIAITEAGNPLVRNGTNPAPYDESYRTKGNDAGREGYIINATDTTVNASIYSAIVPSRTKQSYGGLHNFPRFLEDWNDNEAALNITGAFFQLGFSTSATAPYDQPSRTWEPDPQSITNLPERVEHEYYDPPERRWGYDVALQKNPPGKVASRFIEQTPIVSEFYTEPEVEDPYISQLCRAINREADIEAICP